MDLQFICKEYGLASYIVNQGKLDADSTNIYMPTLIDKYTKREINFNDICLAYAACYNKKSRKVQDESDNENMQGNGMLTKRQKPAIIRNVRYKVNTRSI